MMFFDTRSKTSFILLVFHVCGLAVIVEGRENKVNPEILFRKWVPFPKLEFAIDTCVSNLSRHGRCLGVPDCKYTRGTSEGICADGFGVCCIYLVPNSTVATASNNSYFVNPQFPRDELEGGHDVYVTAVMPPGTCQVRLELEEFDLAGPVNGSCVDEYLEVSINGSAEIGAVPRLCGVNNDQHFMVYLPGGNDRHVLTLTIVMSKVDRRRRWSVRILQMACNDPDLAPYGCLQYHKSCRGNFRSFGFQTGETMSSSYLTGLSYAICIRRSINISHLSLLVDVMDVSEDTNCTGNFLQMPPGLARNGTAIQSVLCKLYSRRFVEITVSGPLVIYVVSNVGVPTSQRGFNVSYNLFPCE